MQPQLWEVELYLFECRKALDDLHTLVFGFRAVINLWCYCMKCLIHTSLLGTNQLWAHDRQNKSDLKLCFDEPLNDWCLSLILSELFHIVPLHLYFSLGSEDIFMCAAIYSHCECFQLKTKKCVNCKEFGSKMFCFRQINM